MSRYNIDEFEIEEEDWSTAGANRRFARTESDQPRRSPIRRKDKWRPEEGVKPRAKRNHRKIQQRIKYELYEATNQSIRTNPLERSQNPKKMDDSEESAGELITFKPEKQNRQF